MAASFSLLSPSLAKIAQLCLRSKVTLSLSRPLLPQTSTYMLQSVRTSMYDKRYMDPIIDKEELTKDLAEDDPRKHRPIKAPNTDSLLTPLFYDPEVLKFTNMMMKGGNKERVREITRRLFELLKHTQVERYNKAVTDKEKQEIVCDPLIIFKQAVENCKPLLMTVPVCARPIQRRFWAMKWLIGSCRDKERRIPMEKKLAWEFMDAYNNQGKAIRKKQEVHRICESNRAYAHLR